MARSFPVGLSVCGLIPVLTGVLTGLSILSPQVAIAAPCSGVPNPVYVTGTPSAGPLIEPVAKLLQRTDTKPMTVVWQLTTSCNGVESVALDTLPGSCAPGACITGQALFWTVDPRDTAPKQCDLDPAGTKVDLALSDVFPVTCPAFSGSEPAGILHTAGPVNAYALVMAKQATESAMQAEEAHFVFGAGKAAGVKPWLNDSAIFRIGDRDAGQILLGLRIKLEAVKWQGVQVTAADDLINGLLNNPATAVGILPTTLVDQRRDDVKILAFQAMGQHGAYYPDRKPTTFDKQNVRDGHYPLWGYLHTVLRADPVQMDKPKSANGARLADILLGNSMVAMQDVVPLQVAAGMIPQCAMKVARASDTATLTNLSPPDACNCWFEKTVPNGITACVACPDGVTCGLGKCRRFFCEVQ